MTSPPFKAVYNGLVVETPALLEEHQPDLVIHIGLAVDRNYFAIERGADRYGYHEIPDEARKVISRAENKRLFDIRPSRLDSCVGFGENLLENWKKNFSNIVPRNHKNKKGKLLSKQIQSSTEVDLRLSDDVGNYVCGLLYYVSLKWFWSKDKSGMALFLHIPQLTGQAEL